MKLFRSLVLVVMACVASASATVTVSSPANGATVSSPVSYVATAATSCSTGVAAMGIYVNNSLAYKVNGSSLSTGLALGAGSYYTVVQEWDNCGGSSVTPISITVGPAGGGGGGGGGTNGVVVSTPANNSTVSSPVTFVASAGAASCAKGVSAMGIYVNNVLDYKVNGASLNTQLALSAGVQRVVVQEWDQCGGALNTPLTITVQTGAPATAVNMTASPASITAGGTSTLNVSATNATAVTVSGSDGSSYTLSPTGGTQGVSPAATTTYTAHATGAQGNATATAAVTVTPAATTAVSMTASPTSIAAGGTSTLSVSATNATAVTVSGSDGSSYTLSPTGGTQAVHPAATTTYTAHATGAQGNATANATVTVTPAATTTVSMTASPTSIAAGGTSTLSVTAANATAVTVSGSDGSSYTLSPTGGTQAVHPAATTTYTATAAGAQGNATATATVTVTPAATNGVVVSTPANNSTVGSPVTFVATAGAASCAKGVSAMGIYVNNVLDYKVNGASLNTQLALSAGVQHVVVQEWDQCGGALKTPLTITVQAGAPATAVNMTASPASITAGGTSTLNVSATNATAVTVSGSDGSSYTLSPTGGTQAVHPAATTTYTATATGTQGNATASATVTVTPAGATTVSMTANPTSIAAGSTSTLSVTAANATAVTVSGNDGSSYTLSPSGGTQIVSPAVTTLYTANATGAQGNVSATATVTVTPQSNLQAIDHVIFMLQENHSFDNYFGMLNPYRQANGWNVSEDGKTYNVDGIDDKLTTISNLDDAGGSHPLFKFKTTCVDDETSSWLESYGDINRYDFSPTRPIAMDGFVHTAEGYTNTCLTSGGKTCAGAFTDTIGDRVMGYYDQGFLNYYYYMASQFAVSDRWFSPISSKSIDNRLVTFTGGTTQGLVFDPGNDDHLPQLSITSIFQELDQANVSWKIYYTVTQGNCLHPNQCSGSEFPATDFSYLSYSDQYLYKNSGGAACRAPTQASSAVGDASNSFCIDTAHIAPLSTYFTDLTNGTLPSYSFIESGSGNNDEHPGSGQSILAGQAQVANIIDKLMASPSWGSSVFFLSYDEGGGPYDHVPPVPGHSNENTDPSLGTIPDISQIAVNADGYKPCLPAGGVPTTHCDLAASDPGAHATDAAAQQGFAAQLGFRVPNIIVSPFTRKHYVSHTPMDHTAILKFVENRFIGPSAHLTARDQAQPNLLEFFDFSAVPWSTPPTPPTPVSDQALGYSTCTPASMGP